MNRTVPILGLALLVGILLAPLAGGAVPSPTNVVASKVTAASVTLDWQYGSNVSYYEVRFGLSCSGLDSAQVSSTPYTTIANLVPYTEYCFEVYAVTPGGTSGPSAPLEVRTLAVSVTPLGLSPTSPFFSVVFWVGVVVFAAGLIALLASRSGLAVLIVLVGVVVVVLAWVP